jgi:hypothetical protein
MFIVEAEKAWEAVQASYRYNTVRSERLTGYYSIYSKHSSW